MNHPSAKKYAETLESRVKALEAENEVLARKVEAAYNNGFRTARDVNQYNAALATAREEGRVAGYQQAVDRLKRGERLWDAAHEKEANP